MITSYKITRPHYAIDPRYNGEDILCRHLQDDSITKWRHYFETYNWEELHHDSINDCLKTLGDFLGIDYVTQLFVMSEVDGYTIYTRDSEGSTLDGRETYLNALSYVANLQSMTFNEENE